MVGDKMSVPSLGKDTNSLNLFQMTYKKCESFTELQLSEIKKKGLPKEIADELIQIYEEGKDNLTNGPIQSGVHSINFLKAYHHKNYDSCIKLLAEMQKPEFWKQDQSQLLQAIEPFRDSLSTLKLLNNDNDGQRISKIVSLVSEALAELLHLNPETPSRVLIDKSVADGNKGWILHYHKGRWDACNFPVLARDNLVRVDLDGELDYAAYVRRDPSRLSLVTSQKVFAELDVKHTEETCEIMDMIALMPCSQKFDLFKILAKQKGYKAEVTIRVCFYNGLKFMANQTNLEYINVDIDLYTLEIQNSYGNPFEHPSNTPLSPVRIALVNKLLPIVERNKKDWILQYVQSFPNNLILEWNHVPASDYDWAMSEYTFYKDLAKDPVANAQMICWIAEQTNLSVSEKELQEYATQEELTQLKEKGEADLSAETIIKVMSGQAQNVFKEAVAEQVRASSQTMAPQIIAQDQVAAQRILEPKESGKQEKKSSRGSNNNANPVKKSSESIVPVNEKALLAQKLSELDISYADSAKVTSVFQGNPLSLKEFIRVAMAIIGKEMKQDSSAQQCQKGAHPSLHFITKDKKGSGATFIIPHGKQKGNEIGIVSQKRTFKKLLNF